MPRFRRCVLIEARERAKLTQRQLAMLAEDVSSTTYRHVGDQERVRRVGAWEGRIGAWERGIDAPSAAYVPVLARVLEIDPLLMFDVDPSAPPFTALRLAAGLTLQALARETGTSYTSLHRMVRGVTRVPDDAGRRLAATLKVSLPELLDSIERDRS